MSTERSSLWILVRTAVHTWWNQRNIPPSSQAPPLCPNPSPSESPSPPIGWRAWTARQSEDGEYQLWSPLYATLWEGPTLRLPYPPDRSAYLGMMMSGFGKPNPMVGLHAAADRETVEQYRRDCDFLVGTSFEPRELRHNYSVIGQVECHGALEEYAKGWRAQAMTIQRLIVSSNDPKLKADLEARYQCDVEIEMRISV